jgi:protein-S-isoprenylcysteine O-methyltransferase Ste14
MDTTQRSGVATLLAQLGVSSHTVLAAAVLVLAFEFAIVGFALAEAAVELLLGLPPWVIFGAVWLVWTAWHSWWFPRRRLQYLAREQNAYRRAFVLDIYPWVSVGFSQMWRPLLNGNVLGDVLAGRFRIEPVTTVVGLTLCFSALVVIIQAIRTIGIHNAAFLREFVDVQSFVPIERGIYSKVMHPLFFSGIAYSCGLAIAVNNPTAYVIAGLNLAYGVLYVPLENRRLRRVFGQPYERYRSRAGRFSV